MTKIARNKQKTSKCLKESKQQILKLVNKFLTSVKSIGKMKTATAKKVKLT